MTGNDARGDGDFESTPAFHFRAGALEAIALDPSGGRLPPPPAGSAWKLVGEFTLGVWHPAPTGLNPEPVIVGIRSNGYYVWRPSDPSREFST